MDIDSKHIWVSTESDINGEVTRLLSDGSISQVDGTTTIEYEEILEGVKTPTKCQMKILEKGVYLCKKGDFSLEALFDIDVKTTFNYATPFGEMNFDLDTRRLEIKQRELPEIYIEYMLKDGEDEISVCKVRIRLEEKQ